MGGLTGRLTGQFPIMVSSSEDQNDGPGLSPADPARRVSVVTIVRGRSGHLQNLLIGLERQTVPAHEVVVVRMGGPMLDIAGGRRRGVRVIDMAVPDGAPLPLAFARNRGAQAATGDLLIFLDVDCIPGVDLVRAFIEGVAEVGGIGCAQVQYLPPEATTGSGWTEDGLACLGSFHPARPEVRFDGPLPAELLWTLAIALTRSDFDELGGFDEQYVGYGGEDTDFGFRAAAAGYRIGTTSAARAYHQYHQSHDPPLPHAAEIVANARRFHQRWGQWPMDGWLGAMAALGIVDWSPDARELELIRLPRPDELRRSLVG